MSSPDRKDLDAAIDALAERLTRNAPTGAALLATAGSPSYSPATVAAVAGTIHADAATLSALLSYRAEVDHYAEVEEVMRPGALRRTIAAEKLGGAK